MSGAKTLAFTKMHGAGNDYVMLDGMPGGPVGEDATGLPPMDLLCRALADRHFGVGCDQILVVRPSKEAELRMEIYNADGSQVEMCGNGIRAFYKYARDRGLTSADEIGVETLGGVVRPRWAGEGLVTVDMGRPVLEPAKVPTTLRASGGDPDAPALDVPIEVEGERWSVSCVSMGNPHAVIYVDDPDRAPVDRVGALVEHHAAFPNRTNVEFVTAVSRSKIRQRTFERGVGETLACGSGACAVAVASMLRGVVDRTVEIELRGGTLTISWENDDAHVFMTGPAAEVFTGTFAITPFVLERARAAQAAS